MHPRNRISLTTSSRMTFLTKHTARCEALRKVSSQIGCHPLQGRRSQHRKKMTAPTLLSQQRLNLLALQAPPGGRCPLRDHSIHVACRMRGWGSFCADTGWRRSQMRENAVISPSGMEAACSRSWNGWMRKQPSSGRWHALEFPRVAKAIKGTSVYGKSMT